MLAILDIARRHGLRVIEDAAHALPTTLEKELIGTLGSDATVFSFYANKTMTTGEGGMLVTRNAALAARAKVMRLHGINRDAFDRFTAKVPSWYYEIVAPGFKYNLTDIAASLGLHQLQRIDGFQHKREHIAQRFDAALADLPLVLPPRPVHEGDVHAWHLYVVRLSDEAIAQGITRDGFIESLFADGIGVSVHYIPLHLHPYWKERYDLQPEAFPHSQKAYERMVSLPLYTRMSEADTDRVIAAVRKALGR
jgi:dTDP-4-amino-4,6-dideoxygalactose transaminase